MYSTRTQLPLDVALVFSVNSVNLEDRDFQMTGWMLAKHSSFKEL